MTKRIIHMGIGHSVARIDPSAHIEIHDRTTGNTIIMSWSAMVSAVNDIVRHIQEQQLPVHLPTAAEVTRERFHRP